MRPETPAHLWDAREAAKKTHAIVDGLDLDDYLEDWIRQSAVERQLKIVGEPLGRVRRHDSRAAERIPDITGRHSTAVDSIQAVIDESR